MKKTKLLVSFAVASTLVLSTSITAFAEVDGYAVKDSKTQDVIQYNIDDLRESVINESIGVGDTSLFKEFKEQQKQKGITYLHDDSRKYVDYKAAVDAFKKGEEKFEINSYLKDAKAEQNPDYVYEREVNDGKIVNALNITKDGVDLDLSSRKFREFDNMTVEAKEVTVANGTIKGNVLLESDGLVVIKNLKAPKIDIAAGNVKLDKVTADELKLDGEKEIKLESTNGTSIKTTKVESYSVIDSKSGSLGTITIAFNEKGAKTVELKGTFTEPIVVNSEVDLKVDKNASVAKVQIKTQKGTEVKLSGNVGQVDLQSNSKVQIAEGTKVQIKGTGEGKNAEINVAKGANVTVDGVDKITGEGSSEVNKGDSNTGNTSGGIYVDYAKIARHQGLKDVVSGLVSQYNNLGGQKYFDVKTSSNNITATIKAKGSIFGEIRKIANNTDRKTAESMLNNDLKGLLKSIHLDVKYFEGDVQKTENNINLAEYAQIKLKHLFASNEIKDDQGNVRIYPQTGSTTSKVLGALGLIKHNLSIDEFKALDPEFKPGFDDIKAIRVNDYEISSVVVDDKPAYGEGTSVNKLLVRSILGMKSGESYTKYDFSRLAGKTVKINLKYTQNPSDVVTYTINFIK